MKRWIIEKPNGSLTLHYKDLTTAKERHPEAISIKECTDYGYLEYVDKIKSSATEATLDYKGRVVYKIPYNAAYVLVQFLYDMVDGKPFYYDSLQFQSHDGIWIVPAMWEISDPKDFCERFLDDSHAELPIEVISMKELKALKPTKFWFRNNKAYYKDAHGYFYVLDKHNLPNKKSREKYEKFKDNDNAILVSVMLSTRITHTRWYSSEREFLDEYKKLQADTPALHGSLSYTIRQRGYKEKPPEERRIVLRLPYFRLDNELKHESSTFQIAYKWCALMEGYKQFGDASIQNLNWVEDLIKRWISHTKTNVVQPINIDGN